VLFVDRIARAANFELDVDENGDAVVELAAALEMDFRFSALIERGP